MDVYIYIYIYILCQSVFYFPLFSFLLLVKWFSLHHALHHHSPSVCLSVSLSLSLFFGLMCRVTFLLGFFFIFLPIFYLFLFPIFLIHSSYVILSRLSHFGKFYFYFMLFSSCFLFLISPTIYIYIYIIFLFTVYLSIVHWLFCTIGLSKTVYSSPENSILSFNFNPPKPTTSSTYFILSIHLTQIPFCFVYVFFFVVVVVCLFVLVVGSFWILRFQKFLRDTLRQWSQLPFINADIILSRLLNSSLFCCGIESHSARVLISNNNW